MVKYKLNKSHPRYLSLYYRDRLAKGVEDGITSLQGLTAHGRGEAFDYLLGEKTYTFAKKATEAACSLMLLSNYPVISVNGNSIILSGKEFVLLAKLFNAPLEINLFHYSARRAKKIAGLLQKLGAEKILLPDGTEINGIKSTRRMINSLGQKIADTVFVPLEDGDRTEKLISLGKKVISVDLNPLSRTAQKATITIIDNLVRVMPLFLKTARLYKDKPKKELEKIYNNYNNKASVSRAIITINKNLTKLSGKLTL